MRAVNPSWSADAADFTEQASGAVAEGRTAEGDRNAKGRASRAHGWRCEAVDRSLAPPTDSACPAPLRPFQIAPPPSASIAVMPASASRLQTALAPEWWAGDPDGPSRDYYRLETDRGGRFWVYRDAPAAEGGRWWLHGLFA